MCDRVVGAVEYGTVWPGACGRCGAVCIAADIVSGTSTSKRVKLQLPAAEPRFPLTRTRDSDVSFTVQYHQML